MSDLIDRQTAQRLFGKAILFKEHVGKMMWSTSEVKEWVAEFIEDLPSASTELSNNSPKLDNENGDLISRQAAIDAIGGNEPVGDPSKMDDDDVVKMWERIRIINIINKLPSAQPEITRCKGCKHQVKEWRTDKRLKDKGYVVCGCEVVGDACGYWALLGQDEDFCSYAERRTDEV